MRKCDKANKTISDYMNRPMIKLFGASDDGGLSCRFTNESRAVVQHFLDDDPNGYHTDFRVVDWSYCFQYHLSINSLLPVWKKLGHENIGCIDIITDSQVELEFVEPHIYTGSNLQEAMALATAGAIEFFKKTSNNMEALND